MFGTLLLALATSLTLPLPGHTPPDSTTALVLTGRVVDGTGAPAIERGMVVIEGDRITCVGAAGTCPHPAAARMIDAGRGTIMPGLIDLHVHARPAYLGRFLPAGVTTIRDANNTLTMIEALRRTGEHRPRIVFSGPLLDGERTVFRRLLEGSGMSDSAIGAAIRPASAGPVGDVMVLLARTPDEARAAIDSLAAHGAPFVKLFDQLAPDAYAAAVERARERGLRVMTDLGILQTRALAGAEVDVRQATGMGVHSVEHASGFALAYQRLGGDPMQVPHDSLLVDSLARMLVRAGAALVPTLAVSYLSVSESARMLEDLPGGRAVPPELLEWFEQQAAMETPTMREKGRADYRLAEAVVRRVRALGGTVGTGSDVPAGAFNLPGGGLHRELELLVRAGLTPLEAVHAATGAAGRILGREDLGTLRAGSVADVIVVGGNPAVDIRGTRDVRTVIQGGRVLELAPDTFAPGT